MFSCLVQNLMERTSEYKPANNNAHLSDLGYSSLLHKIRLSCSLFWVPSVKECDCLCKLPAAASLNPAISLSVAVLQLFFTPFLPLAPPVPLLQSDWQNHLK